MPSLAVAIVAKGAHESSQRTGGIPPDVLSALEILFLMVESITGEISPTPMAFLCEAFQAMQYKQFKSTPAIQNFLQRLLGPSYMGDSHFTTYYLPILFASAVEGLFVGMLGGQDVAGRKMEGRCRWCLRIWGIRDTTEILRETAQWYARTLARMPVLPTDSPNVLYEKGVVVLKFLQKRGLKMHIKIKYSK